MKKSILITMLCILGLAATAQTYDTIYNRAANGYYYHWYDTCEDFPTTYSLINLSYTPNDTSRISCVSHYTPEPMMITGGIIWVSDEMYTRPGSRYGWLHDYRPYPEYIMLYQYDAWRDRMVFVDSARWDTATPKIMKLPLGPNPDRTGYTFPLHSSYTADVPVIEGSLPRLDSTRMAAWSAGLLELSGFVSSSKQWKDRVDKISVDGNGDVTLKTTDGNEKFILGYPDDIRAKLEKINKYYGYIRPSKDEGYYKSVNLKYNKQIICRKDI